MNNMREQSINSGTTIITKTVDRVDLSAQPYKVFVGDTVYETKSIIIATGATAKKLDIPGVSDYWMKGISGCAVCDGALPIFRNKPLAVIGGGDVALEEATHLAKFGSKVYVLIRRGKGDLRASKAMQERAFANEKIEFLEYTEALEVHGEKLLTGITMINNQTQQKSSLEVSGLFFAIGHTPNTGFLEGQIKVDET
jgi:thioredoxin reductase (NADPH)